MSRLEEVAAYLNERGYLINNCFQIKGGWQVNVRRDGPPAVNTHDFAWAPTLDGALTLLIAKRVTAENRLADALDSLIEALRSEL